MDNQPSKHANTIAKEIKKRTSCTHYRLVLNEERQPAVTGSKIGGEPYWPSNIEYPVDERGEKMLMLMQINCAECGLHAPLPEQGMLQWFISVNPDFMYGCQGNNDSGGKGFRIIYHETVEKPQRSKSYVPTNEDIDDMLTPVKREIAIDAIPEKTSMGVSDVHFNDLFFDIAKKTTVAEHNDKEWYQYLDNNDAVFFEQNLGMSSPCHQILGYPVCSQADGRKKDDIHDTLLFQLSSQFSTIDRKELVMWGDMGAGYIFINHEDLEKKDFSRTLYLWDCG